MPMPTEADRGTRIGGNARRRRIDPPSTIELSIMVVLSAKNVYSRIPISK